MQITAIQENTLLKCQRKENDQLLQTLPPTYTPVEQTITQKTHQITDTGKKSGLTIRPPFLPHIQSIAGG